MTRFLLPSLLLSAAFCRPASAGSPDAVVVFNEIQYNPPGTSEDGEWVELFNQMGIKTDVSGWRIKGLGYTFPQGTIIEPGAYLVVYKSPPAGKLGPFTGSLDNNGELIELINQGERLMDELDFSDSGRWPVEADGSGATLVKRNPYAANKPTENWTYSAQVGGTPGSVNFPNASAPTPTTTVPLFGLAQPWRFNESGADFGTNWASAAHPVAGNWRSGPGVLANESGLSQTINTSLNFPPFNSPYVFTYYFETEFNLTAQQAAALQSLALRHLVDDGAIFYLNGVEAFRFNMPVGPLTSTTLAASSIEAALSSTIPIPPGAAVAGSNRLSVEVHQASSGNSDVVFGAELDAVIEGAVAGAAPEILINELPPATEEQFWIELVNAGAVAVDIGGFAVSVGGDPAREFLIPSQSLAAGALLLLDQATLGFRPADAENVFLYDVDKGAVLDGQQQTGRLRGRSDSQDGAWLYPAAPTPGSANVFDFHNEIVISEIAYNPPSLPAVPPIPATFQTTELFGFNVNWRYNDGDQNLPSDWAGSAHAVGGSWKSGGAPIGREASALTVPLVTDFAATYNSATVTYYFEREFELTATQLANADSLVITHQIDDGAVFYLNGNEVGRFNIPNGALGPESIASPSVGDAQIETLAIPVAALVIGSNRLSVEVHQSGAGSSDVVFGAKLDARFVLTPAIPGMPHRNSDNQWIEIANRSSATVDIGGWDFGDGIAFDVPAGTTLAPGEHACIARNGAEFSAAFPSSRLLGEFNGSLSRTGEHLVLRDASNNPVDELRYFDSGRWPEIPDGGGASLELRDLDADNSAGQAWAASDESDQTAWRHYSYRATAAASGGPDSQWREFNMGLLDAGVILIDDISVVENPDGSASQKLTNTNFSSGATGWRLRGTHRHAEVVDDPDQPGNKVLRIEASGATEHMHNQIETTLASPVSNGLVYEISFRARWVSGSNQLHTRLYFNRAARVNVIDRPEHVGTPSAPNSVAVANIGPTFYSLKHSPSVPAANQAVKVSVAAADPDGITTMRLFYSVNGGAFQLQPMALSGGRYEGSIPGNPAATVIQFYVQGADGVGAESFFPPAGPDSRALYKVNDGLAAVNGLHNFRVVITNAERDFIHEGIQVMSNDRTGVTIIDREDEIYYDVGLRLKGSQHARIFDARVGYNLQFDSDNLYRGIHPSLAIDRSEGVGTGQIEILFDFMIANSGGPVSRYYDFIKVIAPKNLHTRSAVLQMARYDEIFRDSQFGADGDGDMFEFELIYATNSQDANGYKIGEPGTITGSNVSDKGDDPEKYRWFFLKKDHRDADDFSSIIAYNKKFSQSGAAFEDGLEQVVNVDAWLRGMAYAVLSGAGDNAAAGDGHNGMYYAFPDKRVMFLPHDMDFAFDAGRTIFANAECAKLTAAPVRRRIYLGHLHDIITTTYNNSYMSMWTSHLQSLDSSQPWSSHLSYVTSRSNNVLSQINSLVPAVTFRITSPDPLTVNDSAATLSGEGWVNVRGIRLAGNLTPLAVTWTDNNSWQTTVPVSPGQNVITLEAFDFSGDPIATDTITVNNTSTVEPASALNLAISEIMYHPGDPNAAEIQAGFLTDDPFEYLEIMNIGNNDVSLGGARFTAGITFAFPAMILAPGARVSLARDRTAFLQRYPAAASSLVPGAFGIGDTNQLSNGGEELVLVDASSTDIRRFTYDDALPWPTASDGAGFSLVLIAPTTNPDHALASNWRSSASPGGKPGSEDSVLFTGDPDADDNANGISNFLEHAFGTNSPPVSVALDPATPGGLLVTFRRNLAADDVIVMVEVSDDLNAWSNSSATLVNSISIGDGTSIETWAAAGTSGDRLYVRLKAISRNQQN